uniref:Protein kinase domain-containing protein n=1 Tax=Romanomermis culicivorax TaxID=13658 RepID=A0A915KAK8_ROMCU
TRKSNADLDTETDKKLTSKKALKKATVSSPDELSSQEARSDPQKIKKIEAGVSKTVGTELKPLVTKSSEVKIAATAKSAAKATNTKKVKLAPPVDDDQSSEEKVTSKIMSPDAKHGAKHTDELDHQEGEIAADFCVVGELIANRFEIKDKIRRGGFGQIYTACDLRTKDTVVLKVEELNNIVSEMEAHVL